MKDKLLQCPICNHELIYSIVEDDWTLDSEACCCGLLFHTKQYSPNHFSFHVCKKLGELSIYWGFLDKVSIFKQNNILYSGKINIPYTVDEEKLEKLLLLI